MVKAVSFQTKTVTYGRTILASKSHTSPQKYRRGCNIYLCLCQRSQSISSEVSKGNVTSTFVFAKDLKATNEDQNQLKGMLSLRQSELVQRPVVAEAE
jgi:hypothetical protein